MRLVCDPTIMAGHRALTAGTHRVPAAKVGAGQTLTVQAAGNGGIPASGVEAVAVNITAAYPSVNSWATAWPADVARPGSSTVNFAAGRTTANFAIVKLSRAGTFSLFNSAGSTHFVVDVAGWFPTGTNYTPLTPARVVDTRDGTGTPQVKIGPGQTVDVQITGAGGVPAGAAMVAVNLTATRQTASGWLTAFAPGDPAPGSSNVNFTAGVSTSSFAVVRLSRTGTMSIFNSAGATDVIVDVVGWFSRIELQNVASISRGDNHACAVTTSGNVLCWGNNGCRQLGNATVLYSTLPMSVAGVTDAASVGAGPNFTCALITGGTIKCWGYNGDGELGDGTTTSSPSPVGVVGITTATQLSVGSGTSCALLADTTVQCWGSGGLGQLGNGTTTSSSTPVAVSGLTGVVEVAAGRQVACARLVDQTVKCWGRNTSGGLGNGTYTNSSTPVAVSGITTAASISVGDNMACASLASGEVKCWGNNPDGQLGNGTTGGNVGAPVSVTGLTDATTVSADSHHVCATRTAASRCVGATTATAGNSVTAPKQTPTHPSTCTGSPTSLRSPQATLVRAPSSPATPPAAGASVPWAKTATAPEPPA